MEKIKLFVTDKAIEMFFQGKRNVYSKDKKELKQVLELLYKKIGKYEVFSNTTAAVGEKATDILKALDKVEQVTGLKEDGDLERIDDGLENYLGIKLNDDNMATMVFFTVFDKVEKYSDIEPFLGTVAFSENVLDKISEFTYEYDTDNIVIFKGEKVYFLGKKQINRVFDLLKDITEGKEINVDEFRTDEEDAEMVEYMKDYLYFDGYDYKAGDRCLVITIKNNKIIMSLFDIESIKPLTENVRYFKSLENKSFLADELKIIARNFKKIDLCCIVPKGEEVDAFPIPLKNEAGELTDSIIEQVVNNVEFEFFKLRDKEPLKSILKKATDRVMNEDITIIFNTLNDFLNCYFPKFYNFKEKFKPVTDRDFLDLSIEMYSFIYCQLYDLEYKEAENQLELIEDPFLSSLLNYKMVKYGAEIFSNLGMEIVGKNKEGYIVRELEEIDKTKLN